MKTSQLGIDLIKEFEGFEPKPYKCPAGVWTIGYGSTKGVTQNTQPMTEEQATKRLLEELGSYEVAVLDCVDVDLEQHQFDALVSFAYNLGSHSLRTSTLLRKLNAGDYLGASNEFLRWNKAKGQVLAGLTRRREAECRLFLGEA